MFKRYSYIVTALISLGAITVISHLFKSDLELINIALIHLVPIMVVALRGNLFATMLIAFIAILLFNVLYIPPVYSFTVHDAIYLWSFAIFLLVGYIITIQAKKIQTNEIREILLNTLSHDLKTPLSSILGSVTLLLEDKKISNATKHILLQDIKNSSDKMNRLINNLLDNARLKDKNIHLTMDWCDLEDVLGVALKDFDEAQIQRHLTISIDENLKLFWGDYTLLVRLFANLLDNAFKYSNQNKQIYIELKNDKNGIVILFFNESEPLKENGLQNIFDKFYRLENSQDISGSGIGLFICQSIVASHSGKIKAYNKDNGVCFEIYFPILKKPSNLESELL